MRWRKAELEQIKVALEGEYTSADECAKAVGDLIENLLSKRDSYGVGVRLGDHIAPFGAIHHLGEAKRLARDFAGAIGTGHVFVQPLNAPDRLRLKDGAVSPDPYCPLCGHPRFAHGWPAAKGGPGPGCLVCGCTEAV